MNRDEEVLEIYHSNLSNSEKIRRLQEIEIDLENEMIAQEENMQAELHTKLSEGLRLVKNFLRNLSQ